MSAIAAAKPKDSTTAMGTKLAPTNDCSLANGLLFQVCSLSIVAVKVVDGRECDLAVLLDKGW
jgi:hypothetical protein